MTRPFRSPAGEGWDYPRETQPCPCCERCDTEYQPDHHDNGICPDCHDDAGEVWCEVCRRWAAGIKGETDACHECMKPEQSR